MQDLSKVIGNYEFKRYSGLCVLQVTTDTLALMLEGGQLRLQIVSRDSDKVSRVGTNLTNGDWLRVALTLGNGRYSMQGVLLCQNTQRLKYGHEDTSCKLWADLPLTSDRSTCIYFKSK